ncbi:MULTISPECIES: NAD-dependent 4,6-dehydratase LegB [unclassified Sulfurospirillum]|uniref:NAD-dependent 4,6-dehydratase LegB n=1 Tax=unclassified Sulfurospirillum TaxID=2618290 RepID=UPI0005039632|nr:MULTISPECIES: NAD-dependent 4,6-dehydratase LegB [unclassified Sulfurospirillum]KFL34230.1 NAD-dependent dehydratase [Sulfurospirillum sp. SCADC]
MKKILVTGANGFIGSHLCEMLIASGYEVRALNEYNSFNSWGWLEDVACKDDLEIISGDIRDPFLCKEITTDIDAVFHLAALIAIPYSYRAPQSYIETNVNGTLNICQAALENGVKKIIHTSTSEVYGTAQYVPIDEKHPLQPQSPYSASKIGADMVALSYYNSFKLPVVVARPFNTYGPRQSARAVIPTIITQIMNGAKEIQLGDVRPTRDFNYISDTCRGFMALLECDAAIGEAINIGSNYEISIYDTLCLIKEIMNSNVEFLTDEKRIRPENSEVFRLWCDNTKINTLTGFKPTITIREGLALTVEWFTQRENLIKYKANLYNV